MEAGEPSKVTIHIKDKDDNLDRNLREGADGSTVPIPIADLVDTEDGVSYSIIAASEITKGGAAARDDSTLQALFMIDSDSGVITYHGSGESYATTERIILTVEASGNGQSATATVTITITRSGQDEPPAFTQVNYRADLPENSSPITLVTALAIDPDAGDSVIYAISTDNASETVRMGTARSSDKLKELFSIDSNGVVSYRGIGEDFEKTVTITLPITATSNGQSDRATVTITITNENEPPEFTQDNYSANLREHNSPITLVATSAIDPDMGDDRVTYAISSTVDATETTRGGAEARDSAALKRLFMIDSNGVVSYTGRGEDYEMIDSIDLPITATSNGQSDRAIVTITITDENRPLAFTQANYSANLAENQDGSGSSISLITVLATDPDVGNVVTYAISSTVAASEITRGGAAARDSATLKALFAIDMNSGALSYIGIGEDFERTASIILPVTASSGGRNVTAMVTITITDVEQEDAQVEISGALRQGGLLRAFIVANPEGLDPNAPTYRYQWRRAGVAIASATSVTYILTVEDVGELIEVEVSYRNRSGNFKTVTAGTCTLLLAILEDSASSGGRRNADRRAVTAAQLAAIFNHVNTYIETRYQTAILVKTDFSNPPTLAEVQRLIDDQSADLSELYSRQSSFNDDISDMDTSGATNMESMFYFARAFNQDIGDWEVSNVTNMSTMFGSASAFNQPIGTWNVSNVTNMGSMFSSASAFDQDIGDWDVGNVTNMNGMFNRARAFNQPIGDWDVSNVINMYRMFSEELTTENYNSLLAGWAKRARVNDDTSGNPLCSFSGHHCFSGGLSKYSHATAREYWISKGWGIEDDGVADSVTEGTANADTGSAARGNTLDRSAETAPQILHGLAGADVITGGSANDIIHGGTDNDTINGGSGADEIHGAAGNDSLTGGADADTFVFSYPNAGNDTITDFTTGASGDVIDISLLIESYMEGSSTLADFITATTSGGTTTLTIDPNGDGTTDDQVTIILTNVTTTVSALVTGGNLKLE